MTQMFMLLKSAQSLRNAACQCVTVTVRLSALATQPGHLHDAICNNAVLMQIFMLFLVHAYSTRIWKRQEVDNSAVSAAAVEHGFQSPEGHRKLVMDGPWRLLWPCLLLWPCFQGVIGFGFIHNALSKTPTAVVSNCACQCLVWIQ